ncbi:anti-sigma factor [Neolewinella aurantiaca]|uniref:Anti-sigma factor n=1 Tax=Neolewinella aurantiaca TaxID=2602767 RepID=A0A5C7FKD2_9BACT|nr:anti-sigma factor [Neolewinella aurantiaca]TXF91789.1 anti-sigma factor [Neolewinella aurantiaca]
MNIQQYITSGILELYVLDRLEPAEMREVEAMAARFPEVKAEIDQIELSLEGFAMTDAPEVNPDILDRLLAETRLSPESEKLTDEVPKVPAEKASRGLIGSILPWIVAIVGILGLVYFFLQAGNQEEKLNVLQARYDKLEKDCNESQQTLRSTQQFLNDLTNPSTQEIILAGSENTPEKSAIVFYNPATEKTLFKATNLPPPPTGKQYQLWAIDGDGPKDLGVLATNLAGDVILEVSYLTGVQAFAITLEDEGGKPAPDLSQLQVIGNVG